MILTISLFGIISAKDLALNFAECSFASENYEAAITDYKRFIFFNPQSESVNYAYYKIGLACRNQKKWKESIDALQHSIQIAPNDSIKSERELALAIVLIASGDYSGAEFQFLKLESFSPYSTLRHKATFFRGIASLYAYKWEKSKSAFRLYFEEESNKYFNLASSVDSLLSKAQSLKYKSPRLAKLLSTILPGSGQIYVGDIRNGLNSLIINSLTGYLLVSSLINGDVASVILSYIPLFQRYYLGNRFNAEKITEDYNNRLNEHYLKIILESVINEQIN